LVIIGPRGEPFDIVQEVLGALNDGRPAGLFIDVDQAFHPKEPGPEVMLDTAQEQLQRIA